jgi:F1F0 ATPase subunit 2
MSLALHVPLAALAGLVLGLLYFAGLWLTVRRLPRAPHPALWLLASFIVRAAVLGGGVVVVAAGRWEAFLAALAGFLFARLYAVRVVRRPLREREGERCA